MENNVTIKIVGCPMEDKIITEEKLLVESRFNTFINHKIVDCVTCFTTFVYDPIHIPFHT